MQRVLAVALFLGPVCAIMGVFVTSRRMAFFSDTIGHGALTGVALGIWLGLADLTAPMILFSLALAATMIYLKERTDLLTDTIMALLLSGSMAFGILILSLTHGSRGEIHSYLFGDILAINPQDVWFAGGLFAAVMIGLSKALSPMALLTANEELAHVSGVPVRAANYIFVFLVTITVALSIRLLGIILVTSLLVIPAATARNLSRNLREQIIGSVLIGLLGSFSGTIASYQLDVPCGPAIVLCSIAFFAISLVFSNSFRKRA